MIRPIFARQYRHIQFLGLSLFVALLVILVAGNQFRVTPSGVLRASADPMSSSIGVVDMQILEESHPSYGQLLAVEEQLAIYEGQWYDYLQVITQQASIDGLKSPFLTETNRSIGFEGSEAMIELLEGARKEREQYQEKLNQEMEAGLNEEKAKLEKELAGKVNNLQRQTKKEILNRQVELALRKLPSSEAKALLKEISALQADAEKETRRLEEESNQRWQSLVDEAEAAAAEQLKSYDQNLMAQVTTELDQLQSEATPSSTQGDDLSAEYPEALWRQQLVSDYRLNTGNVDALEGQLLKERARLEEKMEPLRLRYTGIWQEIKGDLEADITEVAQMEGLTLVLDKNQTQTQGIDITNQVLVILQGEA